MGARPVDRWEDARALSDLAGLQAEFKMYPGIAHRMSPGMIRDVTGFLREPLQEGSR